MIQIKMAVRGAEAERLVVEWEPNPAECEVEVLACAPPMS